MKKENKIKFLEISILITIVITLIIIALLAKTFLEEKTNESTSYKTENYEQNKYILYNKNITDAYSYKMPYQDRIDTETSTYKYYLKSTDNMINGIEERITIYYLDEIPSPEEELEELENPEEPIEIEPINEDTIQNFCNSYNEIEYSYKFKCTYKNKTLELINEFTIPMESLKENKKNISINIENRRLDLYLKELEKQNISYRTVDKIT